MSNQEKNLIEGRLVKGEEILHVAEIHNGVFWQAATVFGIAALFWLFVAPELGNLLLVVSALMAGYAALRKHFLLLVLTNKRVLARSGVLKIDLVDIRFDKIESFELEQMLPGALMGYANLVVMGTGNRYIVIPYVANAAAIRRRFNEMTLGEE